MIDTAIQQAIFTKLSDDAELIAELADHYERPDDPAIYDDVPQPDRTEDDSFFPYITIGDDTVSDWSTDTESGGDVEAWIHVWSRFGGRKECKRILGLVYASLHRQQLAVAGYHFIGCDFLSSETSRDPDMRTQHGTIRFRIIVDEE